MLGIPYFEEGLALASTLKEIVVLVWGIVYILHDHIVGGDAIARNEEEGLIVDFIEVADLASSDKGQGALQICGSQSLSHCEIVQLVSWRKVVMRHLFFSRVLSRIAALQPEVSINYPQHARPWNNTVDRTQQDVAAIVKAK